MDESFRQAVRAAARRPDVTAAVAALYDVVRQAVQARRPICDMSGRCCRFEEYGHRLYVTTLELAAFVNQLPKQLPVASCQLPGKTQSPPATRSLPLLATGNRPLVTDSCPFQQANLCTVHAIRPFGCRMFFCDPTSTQWQNDAYERFHAELKTLHQRLDVPYFYTEWRQALACLDLPPI